MNIPTIAVINPKLIIPTMD